jgi:hypothetical protein
MFLLKFSKRRRRRIQYAAEFNHSLLGLSDTLLSLCYLAFGFGGLLFQLYRLLASGNQKAVAFRNVTRQEAGLIHHTQGCNNWPGSLARPSWQGSAKMKLISTNTTVASPTATPVSQVQAAEDLCQLRIIQFDAALFTCSVRELKRTCLQPLIPNAEAVLIPKQDLDPVPITVEEQE